MQRVDLLESQLKGIPAAYPTRTDVDRMKQELLGALVRRRMPPCRPQQCLLHRTICTSASWS